MFYQFQPLGTIIASILNYDQLCNIIGEDKGVHNDRSSYAPCDGRLITESRLEKLTRVTADQPEESNHIKNAPDLRGKFLRGLNQFYSPGEPGDFNPEVNGDPDGTHRKAADFQPDSLGSHTHTYSHINLGFNASNDGGEGHNEVDVFADQTRTTNPSGGKETRPRNTAIYYYIKIN